MCRTKTSKCSNKAPYYRHKRGVRAVHHPRTQTRIVAKPDRGTLWCFISEFDLSVFRQAAASQAVLGMLRHVADIGMRSFSVSNQVTARVRAGYDIDGFMPYVAAGVSCADIEAHNVQWMIRPYHQSGRECGASGAVGLEYVFPNSAVSVRGEYRVNDYGTVQTEQGIFGLIWNF